jgi:hypothetical protein
MTNLTAINTQKDNRTLAQLKQEAKERGIVPTGDKRLKATWIDALAASAPVVTLPSAPERSSSYLSKLMAKYSDHRTLAQLKQAAQEQGIVPTGNRRLKSTWVEALAV